MFDKIESSGLDLSTVFPGTAGLRPGNRGTTREQAEKLIRGVAPFDEQGWQNEARKGNTGVNLAPALVQELSGTTDALDLRGLDPAPEMWWEDVNVSGHAPESRGEKRKVSKIEEKSKKAIREKATKAREESDDEFQV
jgi:hypothetical protein